MHYTIPQLQALDRRYPTERKLLLVPSVNFGRELLGALARKNGAWVGWEVATLGTIAQQLSIVPLAAQRLRRGSDVAIADTINAAFDGAIAAGEVTGSLAALVWSAGARTAVIDALLELRMASVTPTQLLAAAGTGGTSGPAQSLAAILTRFQRLLAERGLADTGEVFAAAVQAFPSQAAFALDHALIVATPGWAVRGAGRQLFMRLVQHGLQVLRPCGFRHLVKPEGLVEDLAAPVEISGEIEAVTSTAAMFYAGTTADELREVLRRAVTGGYGLDEIEISCTERDEYGAILESLCTQIGANITSLDGLPLNTTRIGRALEHWLTWIDSDYTADHIRRALEHGDWSLATSQIPATALATELRRQRIGWGLDATRRASQRLRSARSRDTVVQLPEELDEAFERRRAQRYGAMESLATLVDFLIQHAPAAQPGELSAAISVSALALRTQTVLQLVQPHGPAERATLQRVSERLAQVALVARKSVPVAHALAALRQELSDLRAWTASSNTGRPRRATGGHVHLTNIESAGATSRPLLFLVGLDADRTAGPVLQSPLLPESLRARLNERGAGLATIEQRRRERAWQLAIALSCSQATLTVSYAMHNGLSGRDSAPAPALLQAARQQHNEPALNYEALATKFMEGPVSPVPASPTLAIDTRDVLFANMTEGALLLDAKQLARDVFPGLNRGLHAAGERLAPEAGAYHGLVPAAGGLDPRQTQRPVSPSSLEMLAACSLRWFYHTALDARLPEEPTFDAMVWLNVLERGTALHLIYERMVRAALYAVGNAAERRQHLLGIVKQVADEMSLRIPVSSPVVRDREVAALERDAQLFVDSEHEEYTRSPWTTVALEFAFGDAQSATFPLDDATSVRVHGRVDRVDKLQDGTLRLVDYKTGRSFTLDMKRGAFDGGRKLQLAVYSPAVSRQFDAAVSVAEYRFPTQRGEGTVARADAALLAAAPRIVRLMLDDVAAGRFVPTIDRDDCAYCNYASICRVTRGEFNATSSPRADWAKAHAETSPHFVGVISRSRQAGSE